MWIDFKIYHLQNTCRETFFAGLKITYHVLKAVGFLKNHSQLLVIKQLFNVLFCDAYSLDLGSQTEIHHTHTECLASVVLKWFTKFYHHSLLFREFNLSMFTIDTGSSALFHSNSIRCVSYKIPSLIEHKTTSLTIHTNICTLLFSHSYHTFLH